MKHATLPLQCLRILSLVFLLCCLAITKTLAQGGDETECPYFTVLGSDTTGVEFALLSTSVDATISGVIANVVVEQTYYNAGDSIIDATYVFPMSTNAAVYAMEMAINDKTIKAIIKRRDEAQQIFEDANEAGQTASLLQLQRPNVFQMDLANIQPGDSITVKMIYTELLVPELGVYQFVFPTIVGPRFTTEAEPWVTQAFYDYEVIEASELTIDLTINAGMHVTAQCNSHVAPFNTTGNVAHCNLVTSPGSDFIVNYTLDRVDITTGLLLYEGKDENFFLSIIQPPTPDVDFESPSREYIFIMDISGSMSGEPLEVSKELIVNLLEDLNYNDKFNIIFFAGGSSQLAPNSLHVTASNIELAIDKIESVASGGSTKLLPAMEMALAMQGTEDYSRTFVILTDGFVTVEKEAFELIRNNLNEANFFAFGIGSSVNRYIIEGIAYVGEGESFVVTDDIDASEMAETFKDYIDSPVLTNIQVDFSGIDVYDVEPLTIPDVFADRPIIVYGKYHKPANGSITLTGDYAGGSIISSYNFQNFSNDTDDNIALKYLWARKKIKLMSDYGIASNESDTLSIEEEITLLGLKYSLVTEYTSFVAVETVEEDVDGSLVSVEEVDLLEESEQQHIIKILGTVNSANGQLHLELVDFNAFDYQTLAFQITDMHGHVVKLHSLDHHHLNQTITIDIDQLPKGMYSVSLITELGILDTEQFLVL